MNERIVSTFSASALNFSYFHRCYSNKSTTPIKLRLTYRRLINWHNYSRQNFLFVVRLFFCTCQTKTKWSHPY